ncbi:uncharacterized protein LOC124920398 [Impatiens glandulifera]|uniref:uncharacterized protein LOC124920398 n=1 Tax=Impatiens glandulifera TaxID=253017 RepID=UPI001FB075A6|nr:uncharacterized protein LOC124920398 [Impatiens glandulifera]
MALVNPVQGSCATFPSRPLACNRAIKLRQLVTRINIVANTITVPSLTCKSCLSVGRAPFSQVIPKAKCLRVSSFKGSAHNDASESRKTGSKSCKDSVKLSYVSRESNETSSDPKTQDIPPLSFPSEDTERAAGSAAIQNLFKYWLMLLRSQPPSSQLVEDVSSSDNQTPKTLLETTENMIQQKERRSILKSVWFYFWSLDATIKIPLLIFIPGFLAVKVVYGSVVTRELTPLWVSGPLIVALYVKMMRGIFALYVFAFKQTIKVIKNLPSYSLVAFKYIFGGKLKEEMYNRLWKPLEDIKNRDYKEYSKGKWKDFEIWAMDKYMDFVESIWPYYCRTIRFLKRANLI